MALLAEALLGEYFDHRGRRGSAIAAVADCRLPGFRRAALFVLRLACGSSLCYICAAVWIFRHFFQLHLY